MKECDYSMSIFANLMIYCFADLKEHLCIDVYVLNTWIETFNGQKNYASLKQQQNIFFYSKITKQVLLISLSVG